MIFFITFTLLCIAENFMTPIDFPNYNVARFFTPWLSIMDIFHCIINSSTKLLCAETPNLTWTWSFDLPFIYILWPVNNCCLSPWYCFIIINIRGPVSCIGDSCFSINLIFKFSWGKCLLQITVLMVLFTFSSGLLMTCAQSKAVLPTNLR